MNPELVINILQAILTNLPAEQAAVQGVIKFVGDMIAMLQSGATVQQSDIDALIADIAANNKIINEEA